MTTPDDLLPAPDAEPVELSARTPLATFIVIGLIVAGLAAMTGAVLVGAFVETLPVGVRSNLVNTGVTAGVGALGAVAGLLARVRG